MLGSALLCALFASAGGAREPGRCAATIGELRNLIGDSAFALHWVETTMTDGKPLHVAISERDGSLFLEFRKAQEGLWAQGSAAICIANDGFEARIPGNRIQLGPAAPWLLGQFMGRGATFTLSQPATGQLHISTRGWSGAFAPRWE